MNEMRPEDFGPRGAVFALHLIGRVAAGVVMIPFAAVATGLAHVVGRSWAGLTLADTLTAMVALPLLEPVPFTLGAWFVVGKGDGRGQILESSQVGVLSYVSSALVGAGWYAYVAEERGRAALLGAAVGVAFATAGEIWLRSARRAEAAKSQEEKDARADAMRELARRTAAEIREDREERLFRFAEKRRQKRRERMRRKEH